jgi:hypothetical protein
MPALPESSTERVKYTYQNSINSHSITWRVVAGTPIADVDALMSDLMANIGINCIASTITAVERALIGSNIFNPEPGSSLLGDSFGSGAGNVNSDARAIGFVGRGSDGRRSRLFLFGYGVDDPNFRILPSENPNVGTMVNVLNTVSVPLLTIGGTAPVFHNYANVKPNDHWVKKGRS